VSPTPFEVQDEALEDGVNVFTVTGELDLNTAPELEEPLEATLSNGQNSSILIDLSACEFIDSTGIAVIVRAWQRVEEGSDGDGRHLVLCCANDQVSRLLKITGVESSISIHPDRDAALASLRG
jgi:anti-sigma B factor antagonist